MATLSPIITGTPGELPSYNVGMAETFSWIPIENDANRPLFARAGYITNLSDLSISLSASDINIGSVELADGVNPSIRASIVSLGTGEGNALKVLTQDLESSIDDITIGDKSGNFAAVNKSLSALRVFEVAPVTAVSITNQLTGFTVLNQITSVSVLNTVAISGSVTITNPISSVSLVNQISAFTVLNPVTSISISNTTAISGSITILNPISSVSLANQLSSLSITNPTTAVNVLNTVAVSGSLTVLNPVTAVSITNQLTGITVTNLISSVTLTNPVTALNINNTVSVSGTVTLTNPITSLNVLNTVAVSGSLTVANQLTSITITNPATAINVLNTVAVSGSVTVLNPISSVSLVNQISSLSITNTVAVSGGITVLNPISSVSITNPVTSLNINNTVAVSGGVTVLNPISSVSLTNQLTGITILNPVTSIIISNTAAISGSVTVISPITAVTITNPTTALNVLNTVAVSGSVTITNPTSAVYILNTTAVSGSITILNPVSAVSITNQLTSITVTNPATAVNVLNTVAVSGNLTVINSVSAVSLTNQISAFTVLNPITAVDILNTVAVSGSLTVLNPISSVSLTNQLTSITILNSVTAVEVTNDVLVHATSILPISGSVTIIDPISAVSILNSIEIYTAQTLPISGSVTVSNLISSVSITNPITAIDVLNTVAVSGSLTVLNPISAVSLTNQLTGLTILNPVTSVSITNTVDVSGSITVTNPTTGVSVLNPVALKDLNNNNVTVTPATSSLNVNVTNPIVATVDSSVGFPINFADNATVDAFQRLRISEPVTLFDSKQLHQMSTLFWSNTSASGSIYHTGDSDPSITLSVSANGGYAIRQTTQRFNYQSGKSMLYMFTGTLKPETNIIKRYGCFSSLTAAPFEPNVGLYFESSNDTVFCVQRNEGFLVPSVSADRASWNIDKMDGSGPSGQTIELSGTNIFVIDYEWLGVGRVRYGVVLDGQVWYCHKINNTGKAGAYLRTPNHPIRAELRQTGIGSGSMKIICSTVIAEGGSDFSGVTRSVDSGSVASVNANVRRAVLGVRLQYNKLDSVNQIINAGVICLQKAASNQAPYKYELLLNPSGVNGGTWTDITESNFQYWNGNITPIAGTGFIIANGYGSAGAGIDLGTFNLKKFLRLGTTINGKRDELFIVVTPLADTDGVFASLSFIESD